MQKGTYEKIRDEALNHFNNSQQIYDRDPTNLPFF